MSQVSTSDKNRRRIWGIKSTFKVICHVLQEGTDEQGMLLFVFIIMLGLVMSDICKKCLARMIVLDKQSDPIRVIR